jgi:hypothetical protein
LCDWSAVVSFGGEKGEPSISVIAVVDNERHLSTGSELGAIVDSIVGPLGDSVRAKYYRPITKGKRSGE